jgi:hypothetical protein
LDQIEASLVISQGITNTSLLSSKASLAVMRVHDLSPASVIRVHLESAAIISFLIGKLYGVQIVLNGKIETTAPPVFIISSYKALFVKG